MLLKKIFLIFIFISTFFSGWTQSDSTYWNREFHLGGTFFLSKSNSPFANRDGGFWPGISAGYGLKKINREGNGLIFNLGLNSFSWRSIETDYSDSLSLPTIVVQTATEFSMLRYTFLHFAIGYYKRIQLPKYILELNFSGGAQIFSFNRFRRIRKFKSGAHHNLSDMQLLEVNILPTIQLDSRIGYRIDKKHILFLHLNYTAILNFNPSKLYSYMAFNFGLNKDFNLKPRKLKTGHRYRDNYLYLEGLGIAEYASLNYERNVSKWENFRLNLRAGFGYYESYDFIGGINLVLGNRFERFELGTNYSYRLTPKLSNEEENQVRHIIGTSISYRAETLKNWIFKLSLGPAVSLLPSSHEFGLRFGASVGKRFGRK